MPTPDRATDRSTPKPTLADLGPGHSARVVGVEGDEADLLAQLGVAPDARCEVESVVPLGGPLVVRLGRARLALGRDVAARILIDDR